MVPAGETGLPARGPRWKRRIARNPSRRNEEEHRPNPQGGKAKRYPHHARGDENSAELRPRVFAAFAQAFEDLAQKNEVPLIPFLLEGVGGNPDLNLPDRIHPNALGHRTLSQTVYQSLAPNLN